MTELIINDVRVPLFSNKITINKQVNNLAELKDRQATYTNRFKIAKTPKVLRMLNNLGITGNTSRAPYSILKCKLIYNGIEVLSNGNAYITNGNDDYFNIAIYDGNIFLFQEIGSSKLNELDYTDLQHQLTPTNYINTYPNTDGIIYAVSDNGKFDPVTKIEINNQVFSVFVQTIWEKIFESTPYNYEFVDFDRGKFDNLVLTPKRGYNSEFDAVSSPFDISDVQTGTFNVSASTGGYGYLFPGVGHVYIVIPNSPHTNNGHYLSVDGGQYGLDVTFDTHTLSNDCVYKIIKNGTSTIYEENIAILPYASNNPNVTISRNVVVTLSAGDYIESVVQFKNIGANYNATTQTYNATSNWRSLNTSVIDLSVNDFIGDLSQKAFMKSIMQHFGFMIQPKHNTNIYQFKRIQDILLDTDNAIDWSDKFVKVKKESYQLKGYAQLNRMAYNYFDENSDKFADGFLEVDNKNLKTEKTIFRSSFNACNTSSTLMNNSNVTSTPFWQAIRDELTGAVTEYKSIDNKNYIAEIKRIHETINYGLTDAASIVYTGNVPRLDFSNLRYNTIINENYKQLKVVLDWNNVKEIEVRLTAKEIKEFDFFKLIYIKQLSSFFYVNKVSYSGKAVSKAEVVQVKKVPYECDLVANAGSYANIVKEVTQINLNGTGSLGAITTWFWEIVSEPALSVAAISDTSISNTELTGLTAVGQYVIKLTVSNANCSSISEVTITQLG